MLLSPPGVISPSGANILNKSETISFHLKDNLCRKPKSCQKIKVNSASNFSSKRFLSTECEKTYMVLLLWYRFVPKFSYLLYTVGKLNSEKNILINCCTLLYCEELVFFQGMDVTVYERNITWFLKGICFPIPISSNAFNCLLHKKHTNLYVTYSSLYICSLKYSIFSEKTLYFSPISVQIICQKLTMHYVVLHIHIIQPVATHIYELICDIHSEKSPIHFNRQLLTYINMCTTIYT